MRTRRRCLTEKVEAEAIVWWLRTVPIITRCRQVLATLRVFCVSIVVFSRRIQAGQDFQIPIRISPLNDGYATLTNQDCHRHLRIDNYRGMIKPHSSDSLALCACKIFRSQQKQQKEVWIIIYPRQSQRVINSACQTQSQTHKASEMILCNSHRSWMCISDICQDFVHLTYRLGIDHVPRFRSTPPCNSETWHQNTSAYIEIPKHKRSAFRCFQTFWSSRNGLKLSAYNMTLVYTIVKLTKEGDGSLLRNLQITLITTSKPLFSPPSYLKLHIPSVFSFQYAPVAECIPLLPTWGLPSLPVASFFISLVSVFAAELSCVALPLLRAEVGTRCWIIVLLTAYLYEGEPPAGDDSEMRDFRIEFLIETTFRSCKPWGGG